jgi:hypothetical protein
MTSEISAAGQPVTLRPITEISFSSLSLRLSCRALIQRINGRSAH